MTMTMKSAATTAAGLLVLLWPLVVAPVGADTPSNQNVNDANKEKEKRVRQHRIPSRLPCQDLEDCQEEEDDNYYGPGMEAFQTSLTVTMPHQEEVDLPTLEDTVVKVYNELIADQCDPWKRRLTKVSHSDADRQLLLSTNAHDETLLVRNRFTVQGVCRVCTAAYARHPEVPLFSKAQQRQQAEERERKRLRSSQEECRNDAPSRQEFLDALMQGTAPNHRLLTEKSIFWHLHQQVDNYPSLEDSFVSVSEFGCSSNVSFYETLVTLQFTTNDMEANTLLQNGTMAAHKEMEEHFVQTYNQLSFSLCDLPHYRRVVSASMVEDHPTSQGVVVLKVVMECRDCGTGLPLFSESLATTMTLNETTPLDYVPETSLVMATRMFELTSCFCPQNSTGFRAPTTPEFLHFYEEKTTRNESLVSVDESHFVNCTNDTGTFTTIVYLDYHQQHQLPDLVLANETDQLANKFRDAYNRLAYMTCDEKFRRILNATVLQQNLNVAANHTNRSVAMWGDDFDGNATYWSGSIALEINVECRNCQATNASVLTLFEDLYWKQHSRALTVQFSTSTSTGTSLEGLVDQCVCPKGIQPGDREAASVDEFKGYFNQQAWSEGNDAAEETHGLLVLDHVVEGHSVECGSNVTSFGSEVISDVLILGSVTDEEIRVLEEAFLKTYNSLSFSICDGFFRSVTDVRLTLGSTNSQYFRRRGLQVRPPSNATTIAQPTGSLFNETLGQNYTSSKQEEPQSMGSARFSITGECRNCPVSQSRSFNLFNDLFRRLEEGNGLITAPVYDRVGRNETCVCPTGSKPSTEGPSIASFESLFTEEVNKAAQEGAIVSLETTPNHFVEAQPIPCGSNAADFQSEVFSDMTLNLTSLTDKEIGIIEGAFRKSFNDLSYSLCDNHFRSIGTVKLSLVSKNDFQPTRRLQQTGQTVSTPGATGSLFNETLGQNYTSNTKEPEQMASARFSITGECRNCDVSGGGYFNLFDDLFRRLQTGRSDTPQPLVRERNLQQGATCLCPLGSEPTRGGATIEQFQEFFNNELEETIQTGELVSVQEPSSSIAEGQPVDCGQELQHFQSAVYADLDLDPTILEDEQRLLLEEIFKDSYNTLSFGLCDGLFRTIETAEVVPVLSRRLRQGTDLLENATSTATEANASRTGSSIAFVITGSCRNCAVTDSGVFNMFEHSFRRKLGAKRVLASPPQAGANLVESNGVCVCPPFTEPNNASAPTVEAFVEVFNENLEEAAQEAEANDEIFNVPVLEVLEELEAEEVVQVTIDRAVSLEPPSMEPSYSPSMNKMSNQTLLGPTTNTTATPIPQPTLAPNTTVPATTEPTPNTNTTFRETPQPTSLPNTTMPATSQPSPQPNPAQNTSVPTVLQPSSPPTPTPNTSMPTALRLSNQPNPTQNSSVRTTPQPTFVILQPTPKPSSTPTRQPTGAPTRRPTHPPTQRPTRAPTRRPTRVPTRRPTRPPTRQPTRQPTPRPTSLPSPAPTPQPSASPTPQPAPVPTPLPNPGPSASATSGPTLGTQPTPDPTRDPTSQPSSQPSSQPTQVPSTQPSSEPSPQPSHNPTTHPSAAPSSLPSSAPTPPPSPEPSNLPSPVPIAQPGSESPSQAPTSGPSSNPSFSPTVTSSPSVSTIPTLSCKASATIVNARFMLHFNGNSTAMNETVWVKAFRAGWEDAFGADVNDDSICAPQLLNLTVVRGRRRKLQESTMSFEGQYMHYGSDLFANDTFVTSFNKVTDLVSAVGIEREIIDSQAPSSLPSVSPSTILSMTPSVNPSESPSSSSFAPSNIASNAPSIGPSQNPSSSPTSCPSASPSMAPSYAPSNGPSISSPSMSARPTMASDIPSLLPSNPPSGVPSAAPTAALSSSPSAMPSHVPSKQTGVPSFPRSAAPSVLPSVSIQPSGLPSTVPTGNPSDAPSLAPTVTPGAPTKVPSAAPSSTPSMLPSEFPSSLPSNTPSKAPTGGPSSSPSAAPSVPPSVSMQPSSTPSEVPSERPTAVMPVFPSESFSPSSFPSKFPSSLPSNSPSHIPSMIPSVSSLPSSAPSDLPSLSPSEMPSLLPSSDPFSMPSDMPSSIPSSLPSTSSVPSSVSLELPSASPSLVPSELPSLPSLPSMDPSSLPSDIPSSAPSIHPSYSSSPSMVPSKLPSQSPSSLPSSLPSAVPSLSPSDSPSSYPSTNPSSSTSPSSVPSMAPSLSSLPSFLPSSFPSSLPSNFPSSLPSTNPSLSLSPSSIPSDTPSVSGVPSVEPSNVPSSAPSSEPSHLPSPVPSSMPTATIDDRAELLAAIEIWSQGTDTIYGPSIGDWDVSRVIDFEALFMGLSSFNNDISGWETSQVSSMALMFHGASTFNRAILGWDTSSVSSMKGMFQEAKVFNKAGTSGWDVSKVTDMSDMFNGANAFNKSLNAWDVSSVSNFSRMFRSALAFNKDLTGWAVGSATSMASMFESAEAFNQDLCSWISSQTISTVLFTGMFAATACPSTQDPIVPELQSGLLPVSPLCYYCPLDTKEQLQEAINLLPSTDTTYGASINDWDVSRVTDFSYLFKDRTSFNDYIGDWQTSQVTDMFSMFYSATEFNQNLNTWDVSSVQDFDFMFYQSTRFDEGISNWNVGAATSMAYMFKSSGFNQYIGSWDVSNVKNMQGMFSYASAFNQDISGWVVSSVTTMSFMFDGSTIFNQDIGGWHVSAVNSMQGMFQNAASFNQDISSWNVGNVRSMQGMFQGANQFNQNLCDWGIHMLAGTSTPDVADMFAISGCNPASDPNLSSGKPVSPLCHYCPFNTRDELRNAIIAYSSSDTTYGPTIRDWDVSRVTDFSFLFKDKTSFNDPIGDWQTSQVASMMGMFQNAGAFNQDLNWDVSSVQSFHSMFDDSTLFNGDISNWNVGAATNMDYMFSGSSFNQDISSWDVGNILYMQGMFQNAASFNRDISSWDVSAVTDMNSMFKYSAFNQNLCAWGTHMVTGTSTPYVAGMFMNSGCDPASDPNLSSGELASPLCHYCPFNTREELRNAISTYSSSDTTYGPTINEWDVSRVTDFSELFAGKANFNAPISGWQTSQVTTMEGMFLGADAFNQNLNDWDVSSVTNLISMFEGADTFNQNLNDWDVSSVANLSSMFYGARGFNQNLCGWGAKMSTVQQPSVDEMFLYSACPIESDPVFNANHVAPLCHGCG